MTFEHDTAPRPQAPLYCHQCGRRLPLGDVRFCVYCGIGVQPTIAPATEVAPRKDRTPWGYADMAKAILLIIGGVFLVGVPAAVVAVLIAGDTDLGSDETAMAVLLGANALLEGFLLVAVALFAVRKYKLSWATIGLRLPSRGSWWLPLVLWGGALVLIWIYFAALAVLGTEPEGNIPDEVFDSVPLVALLAILSLALAPLMEETFFRGFLFGGLRGRWGFFLAALGSGFLFALAHVDPLVFIPFTAVGMLFAWGYMYSGSIIAGVIAHFLFNLTSFIIGVLGVVD